jgi:hypothetical protein
MALPTIGGQSPSPEPVNMEEAVNPVVQQMKNLEKIAQSIKNDLQGDTDLIDANLVDVPLFRSMNERVVMELGQLQSIQKGLAARLASGEFSSKEEREALIKTANDLSKTRDSLDKFAKESGKNSPIIKEMTAGLESFHDTLQVMADTAEYREVVAARIDDLTWGQLKEELRINAEEMRILNEKQKELDKQRAWFESAKSSMEQTEQIEAMKELVKAQKELDSSKERVKGRGEKLAEKRKEGVFGKFLKGLKDSFDKVGEGLRNASRSWITKVFGALLVLGLLIKKGLISPKTIAKVLAFIVKVLISAVKMAIGLIFTGLMAIIDTIWELFKGGDYLAGFILTLGTVIFGLMVLGKAITLVTSIWGGVATGLSFLRTSLDMVTNVFNSEFVKSMKGNLLGGVKNMFGGLGDSLKGYFGKFMPKKGADAGGIPGLGGAKESKSFLGGLADTLKNLGTTEALKGALVIAILATSIFIVAKAFEAFSKVSWGGVAKGFVSLLALVGLAKYVESMKKDIIEGAAAIALLGVAMLALGYGLAKFSEVSVGDIFKGLAALTALIFLARLVKEQSTAMIQGALAIAILGVSLIPLAFGLSLISGVGFAQIIAFTIAVAALTNVAVGAGATLQLIALGAAAFALIGLGVLPLVLAFNLMSGVDVASVAVFALAVALLTGTAILAGFAFVPILLGVAALAILSAGIAASIYLISTALKAASGIDLAVVGLLAEAIGILGLTVIKLVPFLPLIVLGAIALGALGLAVLPFAYAMQALNGVTIDLAQIANLDEAIRILAWRAFKEAAFAPVIIVGALAIGALGLAVLPFAYAMQALNGVTIDLAQIANLDEAIRILAWRAFKESAFIGPIALGSLAFYILGNAIQSFVPFLEFLSGISLDMSTIFSVAAGIGVLSAVAALAGLAIVPIALGSLALYILGNAIQSFVPFLEVLQNVPQENILGFAKGLAILIGTFVAAGLMLPLILMGSLSMWAMSKALNPIAQALATVSGAVIDMEKIVLLSEAIKILARRAADPLGTSQPKQKKSGFFGFLSNVASGVADLVTGSLDTGKILTGAVAIRQVGIAVIPFAKALQILGGAQVDAPMITALSWAIRTISLVSVFVAKFEKEAIAGSKVLSLLAEPIKSISLAFQYLYGADPKAMESFASSVYVLVFSAIFAGNNQKSIYKGSLAISFLSQHLRQFFDLMNGLKLDSNSVKSFVYGLNSLLKSAIIAGIFLRPILLGSLAFYVLGKSIKDMVDIMNGLKLDRGSIESFVYGLNSLLKSAIIAGILFAPILLGSFALYLLGKSIRNIAESMSYIKGLNKSDVNSFIYGLDSLLNFISEIGVFGGAYLTFLISSISGGLKELGESLIPLSIAFQNMKGFDPSVLWNIADSMDYFLHSMLNLKFVDPYLFTDIFYGIMSIAPELFNFSEVLKMFNTEMEKTNTETSKFIQLFAGLGNIADPLYNLAESLAYLAQSLTKVRDSVSSMSDEEFTRVIRVASLISRSERNASAGNQATMSRQISPGEVARSGSSVNGREMSPRMKEMMARRDELIESHSKAVKYASEILSRGGYQVSPNEIESVEMRANIPVKVKINGKEVSLESLHNQQERNQISAAVNTTNEMKGSGSRTSSGVGPAGVSESIGPYQSAVSGEVPRAGSSINGREIPITVEKQGQDRGKPKKEVLMALELLNRGKLKYTLRDIEKVVVNDIDDYRPMPVAAFVRDQNGKLQVIKLMRYMTDSEKIDFVSAEGQRMNMGRKNKIVDNTGTETTTERKPIEPVGPYESGISGEVSRSGSSINGREIPVVVESTSPTQTTGPTNPRSREAARRRAQLQASAESGRPISDFDKDGNLIQPTAPYNAAVSGEVARSGSSVNGREVPVVVESTSPTQTTGPTNPRSREAARRRAQLQASAESGKPISDFDKDGNLIQPTGPYNAAVSGEVARTESSMSGGEIPAQTSGLTNARSRDAARRKAQLQASAESGRPISDFDKDGEPTEPNISPIPTGRVMFEIANVVKETKNMLEEKAREAGAGNAVIMQTQNTNVSNNNSNSGPVVRPMSTNDQYYTKMRFRHHI